MSGLTDLHNNCNSAIFKVLIPDHHKNNFFKNTQRLSQVAEASEKAASRFKFPIHASN